MNGRGTGERAPRVSHKKWRSTWLLRDPWGTCRCKQEACYKRIGEHVTDKCSSLTVSQEWSASRGPPANRWTLTFEAAASANMTPVLQSPPAREELSTKVNRNGILTSFRDDWHNALDPGTRRSKPPLQHFCKNDLHAILRERLEMPCAT